MKLRRSLLKVLILPCIFLPTVISSQDYELLLKSQFLDLKDRITNAKQSGEKLDTIHTEEAQRKDWYDVTVAINPFVEDQWRDIKNASEVIPQQDKHEFYATQLSQEVPFYGRYVKNIILTTAGGVLIPSDSNDLLITPSFIAPFLCNVPPSPDDSLIFTDNLGQGGEFLVQWDRHFNNGEENRLRMQLRLLLDGTITFVYKNFNENLLESIKNDPVMLGLKDGFSELVSENPSLRPSITGFSELVSEKPTERTVWSYPDVLFPSDKVSGGPWSLLTLAPKEGLCKTKSADECTNECIRCGNTCAYSMELKRSEYPCNDKSECHKICPLIHAPICGSDQNTYQSKCALQAKACVDKSQINILHEGPCEDAKEKDEKVENESEEPCGTCENNVEPICGTDNKTYLNECVLELMNCKNDAKVEKASVGSCDLNFVYDESDNEENEIEDTDLEQEQKQEQNQEQEQQTDVCFRKCTKEAKPVCVNGHRSYVNRCQMQIYVCQDKIDVKTIDNGYCPSGDCDSKGCSDEEDLICASNGITYRNECIMKKVACEEKQTIEISSKGECPQKNDNNGKSLNNDDLDEKCRPLCPRHLLPVCASNGQTFNNECELKAANCRDKSIKKEHDGACDPDKAENAAAHDLEQSEAAKQLHGDENIPTAKAESSKLGIVTLLSLAVVGSLAYAIYHVRQRRAKRNSVLPRFDFAPTVNEFKDEDNNVNNINNVNRNTAVAENGFEISSTSVGIANPHSENNWRRPVHFDKANLVDNMEQN